MHPAAAAQWRAVSPARFAKDTGAPDLSSRSVMLVVGAPESDGPDRAATFVRAAQCNAECPSPSTQCAGTPISSSSLTLAISPAFTAKINGCSTTMRTAGLASTEAGSEANDPPALWPPAEARNGTEPSKVGAANGVAA
jgi:hypothetical protein